jgi:hypothetical protein
MIQMYASNGEKYKIKYQLVLLNMQKDTIQNRKWRILLRVEDVLRNH